ncbi:hypothetical protein H4R18_001252 [Coemansia javaensis]|uniref:AMP-dependent synthetase/ligase domain-containing protein n=1 Tax=Coemansia javaensis TaxID=2761396 RepID=A0A9W8HIM9_9FUNG|nr:hypothetical protein H4R18_001252 [Coemansia javaensis]
MAPALPRPSTSSGSGRRSRQRSPDIRRRRRRLQADDDDDDGHRQQDAEAHGLPEYLRERHARLGHGPGLPLLIDAETGHTFTFSAIYRCAAALAENLCTRLEASAGDSIAILSESNVNIPIVTIAAWMARISVVVLPPDVSEGELRELVVQTHLPRVLFVSRALLAIGQQALGGFVSRASGGAQPHFVVLDAADGSGRSSIDAAGSGGGAAAVWGIQSMYTPYPPGAPVPEAPPFSRSEAEARTAAIYFHYPRDGSRTPVDPSHLSHANVIAQYSSSLRRSPSLPSRQSPPARGSAGQLVRPSTPHVPHQRSPVRRPGNNSNSPHDDSGGGGGGGVGGGEEGEEEDNVHGVAFVVLRMHWAYRLHRTVLNIFCLGARYVVARSFDPPVFARAVRRYSIVCAELTFAEIDALLDHLALLAAEAPQQQQDSAAAADASSTTDDALLSTLRFVFTESLQAETELAPRMARLLPRVSIVRTRLGSYVEPPARP